MGCLSSIYWYDIRKNIKNSFNIKKEYIDTQNSLKINDKEKIIIDELIQNKVDNLIDELIQNKEKNIIKNYVKNLEKKAFTMINESLIYSFGEFRKKTLEYNKNQFDNFDSIMHQYELKRENKIIKIIDELYNINKITDDLKKEIKKYNELEINREEKLNNRIKEYDILVEEKLNNRNKEYDILVEEKTFIEGFEVL